MEKALIKATNEIRVENESDADALHKEVIAEAANMGVTLSSWNEVKKEVKQRGEIVDVFYVCKYTLVFNDAKSPQSLLDNIEYNMKTSFASEVPFDEI